MLWLTSCSINYLELRFLTLPHHALNSGIALDLAVLGLRQVPCRRLQITVIQEVREILQVPPTLQIPSGVSMSPAMENCPVLALSSFRIQLQSSDNTRSHASR